MFCCIVFIVELIKVTRSHLCCDFCNSFHIFTFAHIPTSFGFGLCGNFTFVVVFALREYSTSTFHHWQYSVDKIACHSTYTDSSHS